MTLHNSARHHIIRTMWTFRLFAVVLGLTLGGSAFAEPINVSTAKAQARAYYADGYQQDLQAVDTAAAEWIKQRAPQVAKPALVLDVDETSLSNWPQISADDFTNIVTGPCHLPRGPCGSATWELMAAAKAVAPTLEVFKVARSAGVSIFFITGRYDAFRAATDLNLRRAGYTDGRGRRAWVKLIMRPNGTKTVSAADYKAPQRAKIEAAGYTIIANIGDQQSDLDGGHAEKTFKLPNPFYIIP